MSVKDFFPEKVFKFCPVCGAEAFKKNSQKSLKCDACGFQYFINPAAAVAAIITDNNGNILFTERAREPYINSLDLPGGFVDPDETAEQALDREIKEELNIHIKSKSYFKSYWNHYHYGGLTYFTLDMVFLCRVKNFLSIKLDDEIADFHFLPGKSIDLNRIGLPSIRRTVTDYLQDNG